MSNGNGASMPEKACATQKVRKGHRTRYKSQGAGGEGAARRATGRELEGLGDMGFIVLSMDTVKAGTSTGKLQRQRDGEELGTGTSGKTLNFGNSNTRTEGS
jgi:hypothetical protein